MSQLNRVGCRSALSAAVLSILASVAVAQSVTEFDLPAQPLGDALRAVAGQTNSNILFDRKLLEGLNAKPLKTQSTAEEALKALLNGTGLTYRYLDEKTVTIAPVSESASAKDRNVQTSISSGRADNGADFMRTSAASAMGHSSDPVRVAQTEPPHSRTATGKEDESNAGAPGEPVVLDEVVVTGSHIRGVKNLSSPVITFERDEIAKSGFSRTEQLIQSLPQNHNSVAETTLAHFNGGDAIGSTYDGSGVDLRGLGSESTLLLLNGRRMAAAGKGAFVDVSMIPLSAIERMEVLTDGASAIYGSDAVGGVVNLVLRKDFEGAETRLRYGSVTEGSHDELQAGQMFGQAWNSGSAFASYEYSKRSALEGADRDAFDPTISPAYTGFKLIPEQKRHSGLVVLQQQVSDRVSLSGDVRYAARESLIDAIYYGSLNEYLSDSRQYGGSVGIQVDTARDWQIRFNGLLDQSDSELTYFQHFPGGVQTDFAGNESRLLSADLAVDGALIKTPSGDIRLALGAHGRREQFEEQANAYPAELDRDVAAIYAEVNIPVVGDGNRRAWLEYVDLTLAARYEDYSDFGDTFNPKVGLAFSPRRGLNVRGTWGTSFKAPLLNQLNPANRYAVLFDGYYLDELGTGTVPGLHLGGNGENLSAEESTNWTAGFDFKLLSLPQLSLSATYFEIDYKERISTPFPATYDSSAVLSDPLYASVVTRSPSLSTVDGLIQGARHAYCYDYALESLCDVSEYAARVGVIVDGRLRNLAGVELSGLDLRLGYGLSSPFGEWGFQLSGSRMFKNRQQVIAGSPQTNQMNDVWQPIDLRLRNSVTFSRDGLSVMAAISYVDEYQDRRQPLTRLGSTRSRVASWTTVDLSAQYEFKSFGSSDWLDNLTVQFGAINLFDRDPPFVSSSSGLNYDGVNANALGRFLSMQITAQWGRR